MDCLYCEVPMFKRQHLNNGLNGIGFVFYHCDKCGRDFDKEKNIIDKDGNRLNDRGELIGETT